MIILFSLLFLLLVIYTVIRFTKLKKSVDFEKEMANMKLRFFTDISHELRTPLTLITSPIDEVLHQEKLSETGRGNMKVAKNNADRMLRLINQILDFRKIQNDKMKLFVEQTDVIPVIRKVYDNFNHLAQTKQINYKLSCELNTFVMYVDVDKLEKIIYNLLSNAFKYTSTSKSISLRISVNQTDLELEIEDEGRGINSHKLGQLFTRFETDDFNPTISTGIGLSLVKEYIGLMHGTVKVSSKPGEGSLFMLKIPGSYECYKNDSNVEFVLKDEIASVESSEMRIDETTNSDKEIRILIIEDNEELRSFIRSILSND